MNNSFRTLDDADFRGKRVLVRVDLNVPMENGKVSDATRIDRILPTLREIADKGGKVILLAHFGRPKGGPDEANSLKSIAPVLSQHLGKPVAFAPDCIGKAAEAAIAKMRDGDILLLENTRFHKGEEKNDPAFVDALAELGDIYVNDAFSAAHRAHASTEGLAHKLPAYAGRTMQAELEALGKALDNPVPPPDGCCRWRENLDEARTHRQSYKQSRHSGDRRRHGEYVPRRRRQGDRQIAL
jgi:phosphoglycerate kinase